MSYRTFKTTVKGLDAREAHLFAVCHVCNAVVFGFKSLLDDGFFGLPMEEEYTCRACRSRPSAKAS